MRKIQNSLILFASLMIALFLSAQTSQACSCAVNNTVDKDFVQVPNIAVFKVQSFEKYAESEKGYGYGGIKQSRLTIEKVFKGNLKVGQELVFSQGGGADCIWTFSEKSVGEEFLFYLGAKPVDNKSSENVIAATGQFPRTISKNVWVAFTCSRSGSVKYCSSDLKYLENISKVRGKTRLSGTISQLIESSIQEVEYDYRFLANRIVRIVGNGKNIELKTDENGFYEIYDLPVGKYQVSIEPIAGYKTTRFDDPTVETTVIQVRPRQHIETNFTYYIDNSINGKILDATGKGLKDVCLQLIPTHGEIITNFFNFDCSEKDGLFNLNEIPTGKYIIVVNYDDEISASEPFRMFYYPNVTKREAAKEISIGAGQHIKDIIITAPTTAELITVSGVVVFENGIPKEKDGYEFISVEFVPDNNDKKTTRIDGESMGFIDEKGNFTLQILKGQKGKFYGKMLTFIGDRINCPKLDRLLRKQSGRKMDIITNTVISDGNKDLNSVILKFPFPSCRKAIIE